MPEFLKGLFSNRRIPPKRRVLGPVVSALISFLLPGASQAVNGQTVKGITLLFLSYGLASAANTLPAIGVVANILHWTLMIVSSSDAYFISSRMGIGEEVRAWSFLFFHIEAPTESGVSSASRKNRGTRTLITGATLADGTGAPAMTADVLLEGDIIRFIRPHLERKEKEYLIVSGEGRILMPGFINPCCCCEATVMADPEGTGAVRQGITTEIAGQNGQSAAPVREGEFDLAEEAFSSVHGKGLKKTYDNTGMYLLGMENLHYTARLESMVGYGTLRSTVFGNVREAPDGEELRRLCSRVRSGLESGAKGISFGLAYPPCSFIQDEELLAVLSAVAEQKRLACVQLPIGEGTLMPALERIGRLAKQSGVRMLVTNLHAVGADRQLADQACSLVSQLREEGADIALSATGLEEQLCSLAAFTPPSLWLDTASQGLAGVVKGPEGAAVLAEIADRLNSAGGPGALRIAVLGADPNSSELGLTLEEAAARRGCAPQELVLTLLEENEGSVTVALRTDDRDFAAKLFAQPFTTLCTDGQLAGCTDLTLPHFLGYYVRERGALTLEDAVYRNTMGQAARLGLWDRGLLREGMAADLILVRPDLLPVKAEKGATRGIVKVWVNGALQYDAEPSFDTNSMSKPRFFGIQMGA